MSRPSRSDPGMEGHPDGVKRLGPDGAARGPLPSGDGGRTESYERDDRRDHRADARDQRADARDQRADERDARARRVLDQRAKLHAVSADFAEQIAAQADRFADLLEIAAGRGDADRRLRIAAAEREIARTHRRNAARLRSPGDQGSELEPVPHLPQFEGPGDRQPHQREAGEGD
ncbi:MAG TPA: hypothetical protein VFE55_19200 [Acidimicrobiia bacterium]|nr:hypothetical protein [Acidimicrobiia bacterium]